MRRKRCPLYEDGKISVPVSVFVAHDQGAARHNLKPQFTCVAAERVGPKETERLISGNCGFGVDQGQVNPVTLGAREILDEIASKDGNGRLSSRCQHERIGPKTALQMVAPPHRQ